MRWAIVWGREYVEVQRDVARRLVEATVRTDSGDERALDNAPEITRSKPAERVHSCVERGADGGSAIARIRCLP